MVIYKSLRNFELGSTAIETYPAGRNLSVGRQSLQVCLDNRHLGVLAGFTTRGSHDVTWRRQGIRKCSVLNLPKLSQLWWCNNREVKQFGCTETPEDGHLWPKHVVLSVRWWINNCCSLDRLWIYKHLIKDLQQDAEIQNVFSYYYFEILTISYCYGECTVVIIYHSRIMGNCSKPSQVATYFTHTQRCVSWLWRGLKPCERARTLWLSQCSNGATSSMKSWWSQS
jgi:hypothetical protein